MKILTAASVAVVAICYSQPSSAAVIQSLDRITFQAALANTDQIGLQSFDSLTSGTTLSNDGFITYTSSFGVPIITNAFLTSTAPNGLGRTGQGFFSASDNLRLTFSEAISAFAIDFNTFATLNGSYTATLSTGDVVLSRFEAFPGAGTGQFIGFVSDTSFTSVLLSAGPSGGNAFSLDTLIFGQREAVTGAVPEPASWAMMIGGFGLIGGSMRRRKVTTRVAFAIA